MSDVIHLRGNLGDKGYPNLANSPECGRFVVHIVPKVTDNLNEVTCGLCVRTVRFLQLSIVELEKKVEKQTKTLKELNEALTNLEKTEGKQDE